MKFGEIERLYDEVEDLKDFLLQAEHTGRWLAKRLVVNALYRKMRLSCFAEVCAALADWQVSGRVRQVVGSARAQAQAQKHLWQACDAAAEHGHVSCILRMDPTCASGHKNARLAQPQRPAKFESWIIRRRGKVHENPYIAYSVTQEE